MNDSRPDRFTTRPRLRLLRAANALGALVAAGFAIVALVRPDLLVPGGGAGLGFYSAVYAARQLPFTAVLLWLLARPDRGGLVPMLVVAGLIQLADVLIGIRYGQPNMVVGGSVLALLHLGTAARLRGIHSGSRPRVGSPA